MLHEMMPESVNKIVIALCTDYGRRADAIRDRSVTRRTEMEYRYINYKMYNAAVEVVGEDDSEVYISEIGGNIGYVNSEILHLSEMTYKVNKRAVKENIARKLHLID